MSCPYCGTLTGIHSFSFNSQGKYEEEFVPYWNLVKDPSDDPQLTLYHYEWIES